MSPGASGCRFQAPLAVAGPRSVAGSGGGNSQRARNGGRGGGERTTRKRQAKKPEGARRSGNTLRGAQADHSPRAARATVRGARSAGRRRRVERESGARGSTSKDERKRRPIHKSTARAPPCLAAAARPTQTTRLPTRQRPHRAGVADRDPRGRGGGSHGTEHRAKRRRDTTRRGGGPE